MSGHLTIIHPPTQPALLYNQQSSSGGADARCAEALGLLRDQSAPTGVRCFAEGEPSQCCPVGVEHGRRQSRPLGRSSYAAPRQGGGTTNSVRITDEGYTAQRTWNVIAAS